MPPYNPLAPVLANNPFGQLYTSRRRPEPLTAPTAPVVIMPPPEGRYDRADARHERFMEYTRAHNAMTPGTPAYDLRQLQNEQAGLASLPYAYGAQAAMARGSTPRSQMTPLDQAKALEAFSMAGVPLDEARRRTFGDEPAPTTQPAQPSELTGATSMERTNVSGGMKPVGTKRDIPITPAIANEMLRVATEQNPGAPAPSYNAPIEGSNPIYRQFARTMADYGRDGYEVAGKMMDQGTLGQFQVPRPDLGTTPAAPKRIADYGGRSGQFILPSGEIAMTDATGQRVGGSMGQVAPLPPQPVMGPQTDNTPLPTYPANDILRHQSIAGFPASMQPLDDRTAQSILAEAGGDKDRARRIARDRGYAF